MTPIYNSNSTIPHHRRNSTAHTPLLLPLFPARPAKQPLPREIHTSRQVYPLNYSEISTSLSTCRRSNDFCATRHNTARPIYFYAIIYIIRTSTVICSDNIYIYIYAVISTSGASRNGKVWLCPSVVRTRTISNVFVFCCLCFVSFSRPFGNHRSPY